jgi:cytochrome c553
MPASFIIDSLKQFQSRKRYNLPMLPYTEPRELSDRDMKDVAAYVESLQLPSSMPVLPANASALERLEAIERVLIIPRVHGDVEKGKAQFMEECADCHGKDGRGRASRDAPGLVGQYTNYLVAQAKAFKKGARAADEGHPMHGVLDDVDEQQFTDLLAFLTSVQEGEASTDAGTTADAGRPR